MKFSKSKHIKCIGLQKQLASLVLLTQQYKIDQNLSQFPLSPKLSSHVLLAAHLNAVQLSLRAKLLEDYFPVISLCLVVLLLLSGPVESQVGVSSPFTAPFAEQL